MNEDWKDELYVPYIPLWLGITIVMGYIFAVGMVLEIISYRS